MKLFYFFLTLLLFSIHCVGQSRSYLITGNVLDSIHHEPLPFATVYVKNADDSSLAGYALTDENGHFLLKDIPKDQSLPLTVFYTGYKRYSKVLEHATVDTLKMGAIYLSRRTNELQAVDVVGEKPPIAIKGDTIEFNASSFHPRPNSVLSGLLKKLPGVDVDSKGNITANGKRVDKILVGGKKFFGNGPKIALQNLPAAIVDKVQVMDTKREAEFSTGMGVSNTATINISLKKGKDHGVFGRAYAGYGTDKRYDASTLMNYFEGQRQISLLGAVNNINEVGFSLNEIVGLVGANNLHSVSADNSTGSFEVNGMNFGSAGEGIKRTVGTGANYNDDFGKHFSVNGNYFYGRLNLDNETKILRQYILPDSIFDYSTEATTHNNTFNHRANATINYKDSRWKIYYEPGISITRATGFDRNDASSKNEKEQLINRGSNLFTRDDETRNLTNALNINRSLKKKGQSFTIHLSSQNQTTSGNDFNDYQNFFYTGNGENDSASQNITNRIKKDNYFATLQYQQPLINPVQLMIGYHLDWEHGLTDKETYTLNPTTEKYSEFDSTFSNNFRSNIIEQRPAVGLITTLDSGRWRLVTTAHFTIIKFHHFSFTHEIPYDKSFFFVSPELYLQRKLKSGNLTLNYSTHVIQPTINQLLPVEDNTNTLHIIKGNPELKPSYIRSIGFTYNNFDMKSGNYISLRLGYNATQDAITNTTLYDDQLRQFTTYTNIGGNKGINANLNLSKTKKNKDDHWQVKLNSVSNIRKRHAFVNDIPYTIKSLDISLNPSVTYGYMELFELTPSYDVNYQYGRYDIKSLNNRENIQQQFGFSGTLYWPKRITWTSDINYLHNSDVVPGFDRGHWLWNASIGLDLFSESQATIELSVFDLLNQNISVQRNITDTYIEDRQTIILHRYFMLKLIYNLSKFGDQEKKKERPILLF